MPLGRVLGQVLDEHPELGPPVAEVVVADHSGALEAQDPGQGVTDHGRAQVTDVHLLGDVGLGVVDDHPGLVLHRYPQPVVRQPPADLLDERGPGQHHIEETRPRDLTRGQNVTGIQRLHDLLGDLPRIGAKLFRHLQQPVGLEVRSVGPAHLRIGVLVLGRQRARHRCGQSSRHIRDQRANRSHVSPK